MTESREKVVLFMPAYFAEKTLLSVYNKIPKAHIDEMVLVDDHSADQIERVAKDLDIHFYKNDRNLGYGGNLKMCMKKSLELGADILVELHPDDQYDPSAVPEALEKIRSGYDFVLGTRFSKFGSALRDSMPFWKYAINRLSCVPAWTILGAKLTDFHCGFRVYRRNFLENINYEKNSNDYLFSFEIIAQACYADFKVGEVPVVCRYYPGATQINFRKSMRYGGGALKTLWRYLKSRIGTIDPLFHPPKPEDPVEKPAIAKH